MSPSSSMSAHVRQWLLWTKIVPDIEISIAGTLFLPWEKNSKIKAISVHAKTINSDHLKEIIICSNSSVIINKNKQIFLFVS